MPEILISEITAEALTEHMQVASRSVIAGEGSIESGALLTGPERWTDPKPKASYKPISPALAKDALKKAEQKSKRYSKWPRRLFRNQGQVDGILFNALKHLIRFAEKFDSAFRKHDKILRQLIPKAGVLHVSVTDLQREYLRLSARVDLLEGQVRQHRAQNQKQQSEIEKIKHDREQEGQVILELRHEMEWLTSQIGHFRREVRSMAEAGGVTPVTGPQTATSSPGPASRGDTGLYLAFENQFRGSEVEISHRFEFYLPFIEELASAIGPVTALDIGCGRGEWLDLLTKRGVRACGVDTNQGMVGHAQERGLDVIFEDGIAYLRRQPSSSLGLVTAFHVVEHLTYDNLLELLGQVARVLVPGGLAIFETPNPANVLVSTYNFNLDPTHRNPLPAPLLKFLCQSSGFGRNQILELHAPPAEVQVPVEGSPALAERFNQLFYGPQDYAALAWISAR